VSDRRHVDSSPDSIGWPALTVGALVAGILAMGVGRAASSLFPRDSEAALLAHIIVALTIAGSAGLGLGTSGALRDRWRTIRRN
jgi:hypothetical protein